MGHFDKRNAGGGVVIVAVIGEKKILLIKETTKPLPHYWKFVSETLNTDDFKRIEPVLNGLRGGLREEIGLKLEVRMIGNEVMEITDPRVKCYKELLPPRMVGGHSPHMQHFWGVVVNDELIEQLSGKHLIGDANERIVTQAFDRSKLPTMKDFMPKHLGLLKELEMKV